MNVESNISVYVFHERPPIERPELRTAPNVQGNGHPIYIFVGSDAGGKAAAIAYTLIETAKLSAVDPRAWLADTLARILDYKNAKVDDLLPWHWSG